MKQLTFIFLRESLETNKLYVNIFGLKMVKVKINCKVQQYNACIWTFN